MKPHQTDHAADRFAAMHQAAESGAKVASDCCGQFQIDTGTAFALEQPQETLDGARVIREREAKEQARIEAEARQQKLF